MRGEFSRGSMGPKVEAALAYMEAGGRRALITAPESIGLALGGFGRDGDSAAAGSDGRDGGSALSL